MWAQGWTCRGMPTWCEALRSARAIVYPSRGEARAGSPRDPGTRFLRRRLSGQRVFSLMTRPLWLDRVSAGPRTAVPTAVVPSAVVPSAVCRRRRAVRRLARRPGRLSVSSRWPASSRYRPCRTNASSSCPTATPSAARAMSRAPRTWAATCARSGGDGGGDLKSGLPCPRCPSSALSEAPGPRTAHRPRRRGRPAADGGTVRAGGAGGEHPGSRRSARPVRRPVRGATRGRCSPRR